MISKGAKDWNNGLYAGCLERNIEIIELMISKGANDWVWGLRGACFGGHMDIVNLMIEKGAKNWNDGLSSASQKGHMNIVNLMISKGADKKFIIIWPEMYKKYTIIDMSENIIRRQILYKYFPDDLVRKIESMIKKL
jgi:hypothetical protein